MDKQRQNWYRSLHRLREAYTAYKEKREREIERYRAYWPEMLKEYKARKAGNR